METQSIKNTTLGYLKGGFHLFDLRNVIGNTVYDISKMEFNSEEVLCYFRVSYPRLRLAL